MSKAIVMRGAVALVVLGLAGFGGWVLREMLERSPTIEYVADRRFVSDANVLTTTGISASMPMMLMLIEAIAGHAKAQAVANDLGIDRWGARHSSSAFRLTRPFATTVLANRLAVWNREGLGIGLEPGMDEVSLALVTDAWSRTYRSRAFTFAASPSAVATAHGVRVLPDLETENPPQHHRLSTFPSRRPAQALDGALAAVAERYGERTAYVVTMQLEYAR